MGRNKEVKQIGIMKTPKNYKKSLQEGKLTKEMIEHVLFSYYSEYFRARDLLFHTYCGTKRMWDLSNRMNEYREKIVYLSKKFNIKPEEIKREPNEVLSIRFCNEAYKAIINENNYKFYRNEIVQNEDTGKFNISVSNNPNDTLLKEDQESLSLYRSTTEGGNSYRYYVVGNNDYIYVTKIKGKYNYDFMEFSSE